MAALAAAGLVAAVVVSPAAVALPRPAQAHTVVATGGPGPFSWGWDPAQLTIRRGEKVMWKNPTDVVHHVTFWEGPGAPHRHLHAGGSAGFKFKKPGVYKYWCDITFHAYIVDTGYNRVCLGMCGEITVR